MFNISDRVFKVAEGRVGLKQIEKLRRTPLYLVEHRMRDDQIAHRGQREVALQGRADGIGWRGILALGKGADGNAGG